MVSMYKWEQVKRRDSEGQSIRRISRDLNLSRNTVKKYLSQKTPPNYQKRSFKNKIDPYEKQVVTMVKKRFIGTRIYRELINLGFEGSQSSVDRYLKKIKLENRLGEKVTTRFETDPGQQSQYDWKDWKMMIGGELVQVYFHVVLLGYSRKKHYSVSLSIRSEDVIKGIIKGFEKMKGVTAELLIDNGKQMVICHKKGGVIRYNDVFLKFCGLYGITPNACQNYRARTKGKCERPFHYLQEQLLRGLEVKDLPELEMVLSVFNQEVNDKENRYLKETPNQRYEREKGSLKSLPTIEPTLIFDREVRHVSFDGYISWLGKLYSAPLKHAGHNVWIENIMGKMMIVYDQKGAVIIQHMKRLDNNYQPDHDEHTSIQEKMEANRVKFRKTAFKKFIDEYGEIGSDFLNGLRNEHPENMYWHMDEILAIKDFYQTSDIVAVLAQCIQIKQFNKQAIRKLLKKYSLKVPVVIQKEKELPSEPITRSLNDYKLEVING